MSEKREHRVRHRHRRARPVLHPGPDGPRASRPPRPDPGAVPAALAGNACGVAASLNQARFNLQHQLLMSGSRQRPTKRPTLATSISRRGGNGLRCPRKSASRSPSRTSPGPRRRSPSTCSSSCATPRATARSARRVRRSSAISMTTATCGPSWRRSRRRPGHQPRPSRGRWPWCRPSIPPGWRPGTCANAWCSSSARIPHAIRSRSRSSRTTARRWAGAATSTWPARSARRCPAFWPPPSGSGGSIRSPAAPSVGPRRARWCRRSPSRRSMASTS